MSKFLPPDWKVVRLEEIAEIQKGTSFTSKELEPGIVPVIAGGREPAYYHKYSNRPPDTITVSASGDAGYVSFHRGPIFATDCTTVRSKPDISVTNYIHHFLKHNQNKLYRFRTGSALPHLYPRDIARFQITLPPLEEQINIAEILDSVDETIEQTENVINKTEQLRDTLLHKLLTRGPPGHHKKWKEVPGLGTIPSTWSVVRLDDIATIGAGDPAPQGESYFENGLYPFIRTKDVGRVKRSSKLCCVEDKVNDIAVQEKNLHLWPEQTILIPKSGASTLLNNRVCLSEPAYVSSHLATIVPHDSISSIFLYYILCQLDARILLRNPGYPSLSIDDIGSARVLLPPFQEQIMIVSSVACIDETIEKFRNIVIKTRVARNTLREALLTNLSYPSQK